MNEQEKFLDDLQRLEHNLRNQLLYSKIEEIYYYLKYVQKNSNISIIGKEFICKLPYLAYDGKIYKFKVNEVYEFPQIYNKDVNIFYSCMIIEIREEISNCQKPVIDKKPWYFKQKEIENCIAKNLIEEYPSITYASYLHSIVDSASTEKEKEFLDTAYSAANNMLELEKIQESLCTKA